MTDAHFLTARANGAPGYSVNPDQTRCDTSRRIRRGGGGRREGDKQGQQMAQIDRQTDRQTDLGTDGCRRCWDGCQAWGQVAPGERTSPGSREVG